ncbi:MAG: formylglycine-generating enzyme family protein [Methylococcales bacterium]
MQRLTWTLHKDEPDFAYADRVSPEHTAGDEVLRRFDIVHRADRLEFRLKSDCSVCVIGSPLATIGSRSGRIRVTPLEAGAGFWIGARQPDWADRWGWDEFGAWVEFVIESSKSGPVRQRMRWILPGRFRMGSSEDEPGRHENEGPQHDVVISSGFWLFDTQCTQALWIAAMGWNPSHFQSPDRPVEQVTWNDCQQFFEGINRLLPGLDLTLPSEAQWEYACRAGTTGAIYQGDFALLGQNNAPALDPIAWYGGNSGKSFDLDNGHDASDWPEKQYAFEKAGTHPVSQKSPNPWGLYDMLGNVWEWCLDGRREYPDQEVKDPLFDRGRRGACPARRFLARRGALCALRFPPPVPPGRPRRLRLPPGPSSVVSPA